MNDNKKEDFEIKESTGFLYKNNKQNDRQPDIRGEVKINGKLYNVAGWEKTTKNGTIFHSLTIQDKEAFIKSRVNSNLSEYIEEKKDINKSNKKENVFQAKKREKEKETIKNNTKEDKDSVEENIEDELMKILSGS